MIHVRFPRRYWHVLCLLLALICIEQSATAQEIIRSTPVQPRLQQQFEEHGTASFLVILKEQPQTESFLRQRHLQTADRVQKHAALYNYLSQFSRQHQANLVTWLEHQNVPHRPFYIVNAVEVIGDAKLAQALRQRPDVDRLVGNPAIELNEPEPSVVAQRTLYMPETPYGIRDAKAPEVWEKGYRGGGVVIGSQDTGVDWEHPALKARYRGWNASTQTASHAYHWFDAWGSEGRIRCNPDPQIPCDDGDHGTHTVGTILGSDANEGQNGLVVGMAPDAQWIGCRNMNQGTGTPASYIACFEFFLAPYPQNGDPAQDGNPALAPHIINNSWYCPPEEGCDFASLHQVVQTVRDAGIMVVASAGNSGPGCTSIQYPISAYPEVFSVGAHNSSGEIASFSSRGPVMADGSGRMKPEMTAPGVEVRSTVPGGGYAIKSGTSMAAPHMAGAVALLWSAAPHLIGQLEETEEILFKSATPVAYPNYVIVSQDGSNRPFCSLSSTPTVPNHTYGYGRLNVAAAVEMALQPASLKVNLAQVGETELANQHLVLEDTLTGYHYEGMTNAQGEYTFPRLYTGSYMLFLKNRHGETLHVALSPAESKQVTLKLGNKIYLPFVYQQ